MQYNSNHRTDTFRYGYGVPHKLITEDKWKKVDADKVKHNTSAHINGYCILSPFCGKQVGGDDCGGGGEYIIPAVRGA